MTDGLRKRIPCSKEDRYIDSLYFDYLPNIQIEFMEEMGPDTLSYRGAMTPYGYANGHVTHDPSRGIGLIRYNILNLPDLVEFDDGSTIDIVYDGDGNVWREAQISCTADPQCGLGQTIFESVDP